MAERTTLPVEGSSGGLLAERRLVEQQIASLLGEFAGKYPQVQGLEVTLIRQPSPVSTPDPYAIAVTVCCD